MYAHDQRQLHLPGDEFSFYGMRLDPKNRWVRLAKIIPWDLVEAEYVKNFPEARRGGEARSARFALGTLIIKECLNLSDQETVQQIRENPYMQYFLGEGEYHYDIQLDSSSLTYFRKRFTADELTQWNRKIISQHNGEQESQAQTEEPTPSPTPVVESADGPDSGPATATATESEEAKTEDDEAESSNCGTLILDATCAPADIQYPTDVRLLHEARRKLEGMMDHLQEGRKEAKPRNYRDVADREYKRFARKRRPGRRDVRKAVRKQLGYVRRDLDIVLAMQKDSEVELSRKEQRYLETITKLYAQQKEMYEERKNNCEDRIVSIHQPHVRPIKRGKARADTEFGAKLSIAMVNGYADVTRISWKAYNESGDLISEVERYRERWGVYPKRVLADKIYRTRANLAYYTERGIRMSGPALGRPPADKKVYAEQKEQERRESGERNAVEGKFGEGKRSYGLQRIRCHLEETSESEIVLIFMVMNLKKILRDLFVAFFGRLLDELKNVFSEYYSPDFALSAIA